MLTCTSCRAACYFTETGSLKYLQWYNLTCNDCGGRTSFRCINSTSCALSWQECTCDTTATADNSSAEVTPCNYANFTL